MPAQAWPQKGRTLCFTSCNLTLLSANTPLASSISPQKSTTHVIQSQKYPPLILSTWHFYLQRTPKCLKSPYSTLSFWLVPQLSRLGYDNSTGVVVLCGLNFSIKSAINKFSLLSKQVHIGITTWSQSSNINPSSAPLGSAVYSGLAWSEIVKRERGRENWSDPAIPIEAWKGSSAASSSSAGRSVVDPSEKSFSVSTYICV